MAKVWYPYIPVSCEIMHYRKHENTIMAYKLKDPLGASPFYYAIHHVFPIQHLGMLNIIRAPVCDE
jgi:hypothetical protein